MAGEDLQGASSLYFVGQVIQECAVCCSFNTINSALHFRGLLLAGGSAEHLNGAGSTELLLALLTTGAA